MISIKNILVATDFGEAADAALTYGRTLAGAFGATLHVLHVVDTAFFNTVVADVYAGAPDLPEQAEEAARIQLDERVLGQRRQRPAGEEGPVARGRPRARDHAVRDGRAHRSHRDRHAWPTRHGPPAHGQRRRTRRPNGVVPGSDRASPGA